MKAFFADWSKWEEKTSVPETKRLVAPERTVKLETSALEKLTVPKEVIAKTLEILSEEPDDTVFHSDTNLSLSAASSEDEVDVPNLFI